MSKVEPFQEKNVICGDAIEVMAQLPDVWVDAIITDSPYGYAFMGRKWDTFKTPLEYQQWTTAWATEAYRILKPGAYMLVMGGTRTHHRLGCGLEDAGFEIRDELCWIYAQGLPKNHNVSKGIDKRTGTDDRTGGRGMGFCPGDIPITQPTIPEAQYWKGYGTALKPAHEPIWLCKKPNEGTYVDNVLKHGCGAMNIDGCRVEYASQPDEEFVMGMAERNMQSDRMAYASHCYQDSKTKLCPNPASPLGRWPANVLVDCYPEEFQGGVVIERMYPEDESLGDGLLGSYSRFFVIPKPSKGEKNKGCMGLYWRREKGGHVRIEREEWDELVKEEECIKEKTGKRKTLQARGNIHITVKPVRLGMWLIKLITPHQHSVIVLDPFCGSGSFLVSALELNREEGYQIEFYGVDKEKNNIIITNARLEEKTDEWW